MVLAFRPMCSVRGTDGHAVWVFSPSGFHRLVATKPVSSETRKQIGGQVPVGSEEARSRADLRPPLKLYVPISGIQLSRRRPRTRARSKRRNERKQVDQAQLFIQRRRWQLLPARGPPPPKTMRPNTPHDPAVESVEECSDMGALVIVAPPSQCRIQFRDQFLGFPRVTALR